MAKYGQSSNSKLLTSHPDLQKVFKEVVKYFDNSIIFGLRTAQKQFELYKQGRELKRGSWVKTGPTVTNCDGVNKLSDHQEKADGYSHAIDAVPYPINWKDVSRLKYFAGYVVGTARQMYENGLIDHLVGSGIDWDNDTEVTDQRSEDLPHFFIYKP